MSSFRKKIAASFSKGQRGAGAAAQLSEEVKQVLKRPHVFVHTKEQQVGVLAVENLWELTAIEKVNDISLTQFESILTQPNDFGGGFNMSTMKHFCKACNNPNFDTYLAPFKLENTEGIKKLLEGHKQKVMACSLDYPNYCFK